MAIKTQGTQLYAIVAGSVVNIGCITNLDGISSPRDNIDVTCLEDQDRTYIARMKSPGTTTFTINTDPGDESHATLHELYTSGEVVKWAVGWSDGTVDPTIDSSGDFDLPDTRSWITFQGYVGDYPYAFAQNSSVQSNIPVQITGPIVPVMKPAP